MLRDDDAEVVVGTKFDEEYFKSRNVGFSATAIFTDIGKEPRQCTIERIIGETESGRTELGYSVSFKGVEVLTCFDSYTTTSLLLNYDCYRIIDMLQPGNVSRARVGSPDSNRDNIEQLIADKFCITVIPPTMLEV